MAALKWRPLLGSGASWACGFAAVGVAAYGQGPFWAAAACFGAVGALAGLACGTMDQAWRGVPATGTPMAMAPAAGASRALSPAPSPQLHSTPNRTGA